MDHDDHGHLYQQRQAIGNLKDIISFTKKAVESLCKQKEPSFPSQLTNH